MYIVPKRKEQVYRIWYSEKFLKEHHEMVDKMNGNLHWKIHEFLKDGVERNKPLNEIADDLVALYTSEAKQKDVEIVELKKEYQLAIGRTNKSLVNSKAAEIAELKAKLESAKHFHTVEYTNRVNLEAKIKELEDKNKALHKAVQDVLEAQAEARQETIDECITKLSGYYHKKASILILENLKAGKQQEA